MAGKSPDYTVPDLAKGHFCLYLNVGILFYICSPPAHVLITLQVIQSCKGVNSYKEANGKRYFKISNYFLFLFLKV